MKIFSKGELKKIFLYLILCISNYYFLNKKNNYCTYKIVTKSNNNFTLLIDETSLKKMMTVTEDGERTGLEGQPGCGVYPYNWHCER